MDYLFTLVTLYNMGNVEKKLRNVIKKKEKIYSGKSSVKELEKSTKEFKELVDKGIANYRGYNLQTIEDDIKSQVSFNLSF